MNNNGAAILVDNISKSYGEIAALTGISLRVDKNTIFGLVGPDGAGKSTLIRILCGLLKPDTGNAEVLGFNLLKESAEIKNNIGYLSQKFSLYTDLSVDENIEFLAEIHGVRNFKIKRDELLSFTRLINFRKFLAGKLSGGMKQKLALACTLIYEPEIIFLDEPTTGVDPVSRREFWIILSNLIKRNITVFISTPYMDEAERFNKIALMDKGRLLTVNTPENVKSVMIGQILEIVCSPVRNAYRILKEKTPFEIQLFGDRINIISAKNDLSESYINDLLVSNFIEISGIRKKSPSLENAYIHLIKENY